MSTLTGAFDMEQGYDPSFPGEHFVLPNGQFRAPFFGWFGSTFIGIDPNGILVVLCIDDPEDETKYEEKFYATEEPLEYNEAVAIFEFLKVTDAEPYIENFISTFIEL